jgi:hypothetical protein
MKKTLLPLIAFILLLSAQAQAQLNKYSARCESTGGVVRIQGISSTTKHPVSYPSSAVRVYRPGTTTDATLYSDEAGVTPLANPGTCSNTATFTFYTSEASVDVRLSPSGVTPFTNSSVGPLGLGLASTLRAGATYLSTAPTDSSSPIAVSRTDPARLFLPQSEGVPVSSYG